MPTKHPSSEDAAIRSEAFARLIRAGFPQEFAREEAGRIVIYIRGRREGRSA
jgi:hypothetical protein